MPASIPAWRRALRAVNSDFGRVVDPDIARRTGGYYLPDPGLFVGVDTPARQALFFYNWLKHRPALIFRLTSTSSAAAPLSNHLWRQMLGLSVEPNLAVDSLQGSSSTSSTPSTKSVKYHNLIKEVLVGCLPSGGDVRVDADAVDNGQLFWHHRGLSYREVPELAVAREMLWELCELNFRFEFLALDLRASNPTTPTSGREDLLLACFPGPATRSLLIVDFSLVDQGLAAESWQDRVAYLVALNNVMKAWSGFEKVVQDSHGVNLADKEAGEFSEGEILAVEAALTRFYTQMFFDFFGRAAILPRRLQQKCRH